MVELTVAVDVDADVEATWRTALDWRRQSEWIPLTRVRVTHGDGTAVGDRVVARTSLGPIGFDDPMQITAIEPPRRCEVVHQGRVVRGGGSFCVERRQSGGSRFIWTEQLELPFGALGRIGFRLVRPVAMLALRLALRRFARTVTRARAS